MMAGHTALPVVCLLLLLLVPLVSTLENKYNKIDDDKKAADKFELMTVQTVSSSIQCAGRCTRTKHCNTYGYCKKTRTCQLARLFADNKFDIQLRPATGFKVYSSVVRSMWELVFNGSRGIGQSIYDLWVGNTYTNDPPPSGALQLDDSCACHYKSQLVEQWASLNVQKVKVALYAAGEEVLWLTFNGVGTTKENWFTANRLEVQPWTDSALFTSAVMFSMKGSFAPLNSQGGTIRFVMSYAFSTCTHGDAGWLLVRDTAATQNPWCNWYQQAPWPLFMYSKLSTKVSFGNQSTTGLIDLNYGYNRDVTCGPDCDIESTTSQSLDACVVACNNSPTCQAIEYSTHSDVQASQSYCKLLRNIQGGSTSVAKPLTRVYFKDNSVGTADAFAVFIKRG